MENEGLTNGYSFNLKRISLLEKTLTSSPQIEPQEEFDYDISLQIGNNFVSITGILGQSKRRI
jgi:hypothetical protein